MKTLNSKLNLRRETLRHLDDSALRSILGGEADSGSTTGTIISPQVGPQPEPQTQRHPRDPHGDGNGIFYPCGLP